MSKKSYVLDTNVLLHDPNSLRAFEDNEIVITEPVLEELDRYKRGADEIHHNAREVAKILDSILGDLALTIRSKKLPSNREEAARIARDQFAPVAIPGTHGGSLRILMDSRDKPARVEKMDDWILNLVLHHQALLHPPAIVVTKDIIMRVKALALGFSCEDYRRDRAKAQVKQIPLLAPDLLGESFLSRPAEKWVSIPGLLRQVYLDENGDQRPMAPGYYFIPCNAESKRLLHINHQEEARLVTRRPMLCKFNGNPGIRPKNPEQTAAVDALLNPSKTMVCLIGKAGTGKTMLAVASALHLYFIQNSLRQESFHNPPQIVPSRKKAKASLPPKTGQPDADLPACGPHHHLPFQIYISRPMVSLGQDMGFLPGTAEEKMAPWMQPILDNLNWIIGVQETKKLLDDGIIKMQPLAYIRGRTFSNAYVIIDEAQNLTPHEVKTILTRAGHNCKIVLTGDPDQIDNPYIDRLSNGLVYASDRMGLEDYVAVIPLVKGERSRMSERAAELL